MKIVHVGKSLSAFVAVAVLAACSSATEKADTSEHASVADIDHMIQRGDGTFDVWCKDGTVEKGVMPEKVVANDVCTAGDTASTCPSATPPVPRAWKPPAAAAKVCVPADIALLQDTAGGGGSVFDMEVTLKAQNEACAACVFTHNTGDKWGPIVFDDLKGGAFVNWGACFTHAPGGSEACGAAFSKTHGCALDSCAKCGTDDDLASCYADASGNAKTCGQYDVEGACGPDYTTIDQACLSVWDVVANVCGGGPGSRPPGGGRTDPVPGGGRPTP